MYIISIGGTRHATEAVGKTLCGETYPRHWRTGGGSINCEDCYRIVNAEADEALAKARQVPEPCDEPDIPY